MKKTLRFTVLLIGILLVLFTDLYSQNSSVCSPQWQWAKNTGHYLSLSKSTTGEIFAFGWFDSSLVVGTDTIENISAGWDTYIAKMDEDGGFDFVQQFEFSNGGISQLSIDTFGNKYITGYFKDSLTLGGNPLMAQGGSWNYFVSKIHTLGFPIWTKHIIGCYTISALRIDELGNSYISGSFADSIIFDDGNPASYINDQGNFTFIAKYNIQGNFLWVEYFSISNLYSDRIKDFEIDNNQDIVISWRNSGPIDFHLNQTYSLPNEKQLVISKLSSNGNLLWLKTISYYQYGNSEINDIDIDGENNVVATGKIYYYGCFDSIPILDSNQRTEMFLLKIDIDGNYQWSKTTESTVINSGNSSGLKLSIAKDNSILVFANHDKDVFIDNQFIEYEKYYDQFFLKTDSSGNVLWAVDEVENNLPLNWSGFGGFIMDKNDFCYAYGVFDHPVDIGLFSLQAEFQTNYMLAKLDSGLTTNDLGIVNISTPNSHCCSMSSTEFVRLEIKNFGSNAIDSFFVSYQLDSLNPVLEFIDTSILPGDTLLYTFQSTIDLSQQGNHNLFCTTLLSTDIFNWNDTASVIINSDSIHALVSVFPYFQDFEGTNDWNSGGVGDSWELDSAGFEYLPSAYFFTNNFTEPLNTRHYHLTNHWSNYEDSYIESPCYDFSNLNNPVFEMKLMLLISDETAYLYSHPYPGEQSVWVEYSTDGGYTFNHLGSLQSGVNWYDGVGSHDIQYYMFYIDAWIYDKYKHETVSHDLAFLANEKSVKFRVRFNTYGNMACFASVDEIFIYDKPDFDAAVVELLHPDEYACGLSDSSYLSIKITNKGLQPISNFEIGAKADSTQAIIETFTGSINSGDTVVYNFQNPIDLSHLGKYNLLCWAKILGDNHFTDDTLKTELFHVPYISDYPYCDDFESDNFWRAGDSTSTWTLDNNPNWWNNTTNFWHSNYNFNGVEQYYEKSWVESPCFDFSNLIHPMVELEIIQNSLYGYAWLEVSTDNGYTWELLGEPGDLLNWYEASNYLYSSNITAWHSEFDIEYNQIVVDEWHIVKHSLDSFVGLQNVKFRIRGNGDHTQGYGGLSFGFDNFKVYEAPQFDIGILDVYNLENCFSTDTNSIVLEIYNMGYEAATNFEVSCKFENNTWASIICTDTVFPDSTIIFSAALLNGIHLPGDYSISVAISHPNDTISENDSILNLQISNKSYSINNAPYITQFLYNFYGANNPDIEGWTTIDADENDCAWSLSSGWGSNRYYRFRQNSNYSGITIDDYLISPCFQLDTGEYYILKFWIDIDEVIDSMIVVYGTSPTVSALNHEIASYSQISTNGLTQFSFEFAVSQSDIYHIGIHLYSDTIQDIDIRFDDFSLQLFHGKDVKVLDINTNSACQLSSQELLSVKIKNSGFESVINVPFSCLINDSILISGVYPDTIFGDQIVQYQLPATVNLTGDSIHKVTAWTELTDDENIDNDTLFKQIYSIAAIDSFPYIEYFEGQHLFTISGNNSTWGLGNVSNTDFNPSGSFNTTHFLTTKFNGESYQNEVSWVESPCFDISGLAYPYIEFDIFTEEAIGALSCQYSLDGGNNWFLFGGAATGNNWYHVNSPYYSYSLYENFGISNAWKDFSSSDFMSLGHALDSLAGATSLKFRFIFAGDTTNSSEIITAIDNFKIYDRIEGCTDIFAINYDSTAIFDDGSCTYNCYASASFDYVHLGYNSYMFYLTDTFPEYYTVQWNIPLQNILDEDTVYYSYPLPINFTVGCYVYDPYISSCSDGQSQTIFVTDCALNSHFSVNEIDSGEFVFELLYPEFPYQSSIEWDFGDGETASGIDSVYHKYDTLGSYSVSCERIFNNPTYCSDYIDTVIEVTALSHEFQIFIFNSGWSIFSTYLTPIESNISDALGNWQNAYIIKDEFGNVYWPAFGINFIGAMTDGLGYQINMANSSNYYIAGYLIDPQATPLSLDIGWHIIAYLRQNQGDISTMLQTISGTFVLIKDEFGNVYWPAYSINDIGDMIPGEGYQIKMNQPAVLTYPAN